MTPNQIELVQASWAKVLPIASIAADLFYDKLFQLDPSVRRYFPANLADQKKKLMQMIGKVVSSLDSLETIVPAVQDLGRRHVGYGVRPEHYSTVGSALLDTLQTGLGEDFTPDVSAAWAAAYGLLSTTMLDAANEAAA